jgi:CheY-like chemotaxis protein
MSRFNNYYSVLLADDSENDRLFARLAFRGHPQFKIIGELQNGEEVISYLSGEEKYHDRQTYPIPDLLLLDLKMPRVSGLEVLSWLHHQDIPGLRVAVLSGSDLQSDKEKARALGADAYHVKAVTKSSRQAMVQSLEALLAGPFIKH